MFEWNEIRILDKYYHQSPADRIFQNMYIKGTEWSVVEMA